MSFRTEARKFANLARENLNLGTEANIRYAALEIRMALECFVYKIANQYETELPHEKLNTWQPRKLLKLIIEYDPAADQDRCMHMGTGEFDQNGEEEFIDLGTERRVSLSEIKRHYDALGSLLHTQRSSDNTHEIELRRRKHCDDALAIVERVLTSKIFDIDQKIATHSKCLRCEMPVVQRVAAMKVGEIRLAECIKCHAQYDVEMRSENAFRWSDRRRDIPCLECQTPNKFWPDEIHPSAHLKCAACGAKAEVGLSLRSLAE
jgi:hypothetical protein